jgi:uncharacterized membrane protein YphA (DoxX/SURF4 family)
VNDTTTADTKAPVDETTGSNAFARYLPSIARVLMGLMFFVFGLNGFLNFIPRPKAPMPEGAVALFEGLMKSGYMFPQMKP